MNEVNVNEWNMKMVREKMDKTIKGVRGVKNKVLKLTIFMSEANMFKKL